MYMFYSNFYWLETLSDKTIHNNHINHIRKHHVAWTDEVVFIPRLVKGDKEAFVINSFIVLYSDI